MRRKLVWTVSRVWQFLAPKVRGHGESLASRSAVYIARWTAAQYVGTGPAYVANLLTFSVIVETLSVVRLQNSGRRVQLIDVHNIQPTHFQALLPSNATHATQRTLLTQRTQRTDTASVLAFWPLRRLRPFRLLRTFLAFSPFIPYLRTYFPCVCCVKKVSYARVLLCVRCAGCKRGFTRLASNLRSCWKRSEISNFHREQCCHRANTTIQNISWRTLGNWP